MSLLKRLGEQANQIKAQEAVESQQKERLGQRFQTRTTPTMEAIHDFLVEVTKQLEIVRPPLVYAYRLPTYGYFTAANQFDFKLSKEPMYSEIKIDLRFRSRIETEKAERMSFKTPELVRSISNQLRSLHLGGLKEERRSPSGLVTEASLQIAGYVHSRVLVTGKLSEDEIRFTFDNIDRLGRIERVIPVDLMSERVLDTFGEFLLRERDDFLREPWLKSLVAVQPFPFRKKDPVSRSIADSAPMLTQAPVAKAPPPRSLDLHEQDAGLLAELAEAGKMAEAAVQQNMSATELSDLGEVAAAPSSAKAAAPDNTERSEKVHQFLERLKRIRNELDP